MWVGTVTKSVAENTFFRIKCINNKNIGTAMFTMYSI